MPIGLPVQGSLMVDANWGAVIQSHRDHRQGHYE